jgi:hypothetical protein
MTRRRVCARASLKAKLSAGLSRFWLRNASTTSVTLRQLVEEAAGAVGLRGRPGKLQCGAGPEQLEHGRRQYRPVD